MTLKEEIKKYKTYSNGVKDSLCNTSVIFVNNCKAIGILTKSKRVNMYLVQ